MKLEDIIDHCAYEHRRLGPVWIVGRHPHDGATIVAYYDGDADGEDTEEYVDCDSSDLVNLLIDDDHKPTHGRALEHWNAARNPLTTDRRNMSPEFISAVQAAIIACRKKGFKPGPVPTVNDVVITAKRLWTNRYIAVRTAQGSMREIDNPHFEGANTTGITNNLLAWGWKP